MAGKLNNTLVGARVRLRTGEVGVVVSLGTKGLTKGMYEMLVAGKPVIFSPVCVAEVGEDVKFRTERLQRLLDFKYVPMASLVQ